MAYKQHCNFEDLQVGMKLRLRGGGSWGVITAIDTWTRAVTVVYGPDGREEFGSLLYTVEAFHPYGTPDTDASCWIIAEPPNPLEVY